MIYAPIRLIRALLPVCNSTRRDTAGPNTLSGKSVKPLKCQEKDGWMLAGKLTERHRQVTRVGMCLYDEQDAADLSHDVVPFFAGFNTRTLKTMVALYDYARRTSEWSPKLRKAHILRAMGLTPGSCRNCNQLDRDMAVLRATITCYADLKKQEYVPGAELEWKATRVLARSPDGYRIPDEHMHAFSAIIGSMPVPEAVMAENVRCKAVQIFLCLGAMAQLGWRRQGFSKSGVVVMQVGELMRRSGVTFGCRRQAELRKGLKVELDWLVSKELLGGYSTEPFQTAAGDTLRLQLGRQHFDAIQGHLKGDKYDD